MANKLAQALKRRRAARMRRAINKRRVTRRLRKMSNKIHLFKKKGDTETQIALNGSTSSAGYLETIRAEVFQFDKIQDYTDLSAIYDRYQIMGVAVKFTWSPSVMRKDGVNNIIGANDSYAPHIRYKYDYDDAGGASWDILGADARTKTRRILPNRPVTVFIRPKVLVQMYKTALSTGYGPKRSPAIDTSDLNVPHYGLKYAIRYPNMDSGESVADSSIGTVQVEYTYYVKMMYPQT